MDSTLAPASDSARESYFGHRHLTVIEPSKGWRMLDLRELWAYRELLWVLAGRDVRVRYKQTVLGAAWAILRPLLTMLIFTVVFGRLAKMPSDGYPYAVWVYAALLPWTFFATAVGASGQSLVGSAHLISKVYFPRLIVPLASIGAALVDLLVSTWCSSPSWPGTASAGPEPRRGAAPARRRHLHGARHRHPALRADRRLPRRHAPAAVPAPDLACT